MRGVCWIALVSDLWSLASLSGTRLCLCQTCFHPWGFVVRFDGCRLYVVAGTVLSSNRWVGHLFALVRVLFLIGILPLAPLCCCGLRNVQRFVPEGGVSPFATIRRQSVDKT